jgi:HprK-related kinase A
VSPATLEALPDREVARLLAAGELEIDLGPMRVAVRSAIADLAPALRTVYRHYPANSRSPFVDIRVALVAGRGLRRIVRPQVRFFADGSFPFEPFPASNHLPLLEWGMNWTIAHRSNNHLLLHAGVVEKYGAGVILSALPGSGKSTLTAALAASGYRHFSDEFGVLRLSDRKLLPLVRPIALKNEAIGVVRETYPETVLGPVFRGTRKGDVAHAAPDPYSVARRAEPAQPRLILFPKFVQDAATGVTPVTPSRAFSRLSVNAFNYNLLGPAGFHALADVAGQCPAFRLHYSDLREAVSAIDELIAAVENDGADRYSLHSSREEADRACGRMT